MQVVTPEACGNPPISKGGPFGRYRNPCSLLQIKSIPETKIYNYVAYGHRTFRKPAQRSHITSYAVLQKTGPLGHLYPRVTGGLIRGFFSFWLSAASPAAFNFPETCLSVHLVPRTISPRTFFPSPDTSSSLCPIMHDRGDKKPLLQEDITVSQTGKHTLQGTPKNQHANKNNVAYGTETAQAIKGRHIQKATKYLKDVTLQKQWEPFHRYNGGVGRCVQWGWMQGRWPRKSAESLLHRLTNAETNAELKGLDVDSLVIEHIQVNKAPKMQLRTYRAHGRINPYMLSVGTFQKVWCEEDQIINRERVSIVTKGKLSFYIAGMHLEYTINANTWASFNRKQCLAQKGIMRRGISYKPEGHFMNPNICRFYERGPHNENNGYIYIEGMHRFPGDLWDAVQAMNRNSNAVSIVFESFPASWVELSSKEPQNGTRVSMK
eukprot:bmy_18372T0